MEYCGPRGIPHSIFLGRVVGPGSPQWTVDDRDKALWWMIHDREKCPNCGTRHEEFDPEQGGDLHAYEWKYTHCRGCEILAQGQDSLEKNRKNGSLRRGTSIRLSLTPVEGSK
jgi:hypothetical protein